MKPTSLRPPAVEELIALAEAQYGSRREWILNSKFRLHPETLARRQIACALRQNHTLRQIALWLGLTTGGVSYLLYGRRARMHKLIDRPEKPKPKRHPRSLIMQLANRLASGYFQAHN